MAAPCKITRCVNSARKLGLCNSHYGRFRRHGDPEGAHVRPGVEERFWGYVVFTDHGAEWDGPTRGPYGRLRLAGSRKHVAAHRLAWELARGPLQPEKILDHANNCPKTCVTPGHMLVHYSRSSHAKAGWERGEYNHAWSGRSVGPRDPSTGRFVRSK